MHVEALLEGRVLVEALLEGRVVVKGRVVARPCRRACLHGRACLHRRGVWLLLVSVGENLVWVGHMRSMREARTGHVKHGYEAGTCFASRCC